MICNSYYGNFRNRKFSEIFPTAAKFVEEYNDNGIPTSISDDTAEVLYYLLYARYGNSTIASSDENQFKYKLWTIIFSSGANWEAKLTLQEKLRDLVDSTNLAELLNNGLTIQDHAYNPGDMPQSSILNTDGTLKGINEQTALRSRRSKLDAYMILQDALAFDITANFLNQFGKLFLKVVQPERCLWYEGEEINDNT